MPREVRFIVLVLVTMVISVPCTLSQDELGGDVEEVDWGSPETIEDWSTVTTADLQAHPAAADYALRTPGTLSADQKKAFLNDPGTDLSKIDYATVMQNHKYVDKKGQNFQKWLGTLTDAERQEVWRQIGDFDGKLTSKEDWQRIMNQETIDAWFDNYQFGDIVRFFAGLEFDEMIGDEKEVVLQDEIPF